MSKNIVIVESPAKAKTIEKFLGPDFSVTSSYGHIRDLPKKSTGIDIENDFAPTYEISPDKKKRVSELKKQVKAAETVWLATDEDREGEAIAWHLWQALDLDKKEVKRIAFHEITKTAVQEAIKNPRTVDQNLVDAQQARRVLDRLVGYEVSPVLWRKVRPGLSAGRVQSVAVRLIVEREREIENYTPEHNFKINAHFNIQTGGEIVAELPKALDTYDAANQFMKAAVDATFSVDEVETKPSTRNPAAPFTTSSLQQTAARKLGFSVRQTMTLAQRLYEAGHITYMRTDSVALASSATAQAAKLIEQTYGKDYHQPRTFKAKAGAQEAHEAIRPTDFKREEAGGDAQQQKLYALIRARTIASQMAPAQLEKTSIHIKSSNHTERLIAKGEVVQFAGFLKVYQDSKVADTLLPRVEPSDVLELTTLEARETIKRGPTRYNEAALVRTLEEMGIGRPSTYAPTISTIQTRGYVEKGDVEGTEQTIKIITLIDNKPIETEETVLYGRDTNKLLPTQIALLVNDFLTKNFASIVDYDFTKEVEEEFDRIADGKERWNAMIADFYGPFHKSIEAAEDLSREEASGAREVGIDPKTKKPIIARMGRYGPMLQLGHAEDEEEKPKFAPIPPGRKLHEITLDEALELFALPRTVGKTEDGEEITTNFGRFGPYVKVGSTYAAIGDAGDPFSIDEATARRLIAEKLEKARKTEIATFNGIRVLDGRYGPYVTDGKKNARVPKEMKPEEITEEQAKELLAKAPARKKRRRRPARS
ncbi:MAG: type I DNA topoisomerase [Candidatus Saccharimonadales bacterium]